ncbi:MAG: hypothetical protein MPN21_13340 [Thermoanaerobaculia bacterium]|nr:hypothetical protein [Thermoanaerobaculia bacterium]
MRRTHPNLTPIRIRLLCAACCVLLAAASTYASGDEELGKPPLRTGIHASEKVTFSGGQTASGSYFQFAVPDGWNPADGLVIWNHGFDLSPVGPDPDLGPLVGVQLDQGYAVAASSYSLTGWALFQTVADLEEMIQEFHTQHGIPDSVLIYGASLGGIVTAQAVERAQLGNVVGALPICGAMAGSRVWDGGLDLRLLYDAVCADVPGAAIPGGAAGLPFPPDPTFDEDALEQAVDACTGILVPASSRTLQQRQNLEALLDATEIPENFLLRDMGFVTFALADLVYDPAKLAGGQAMDNFNVDYGDAALDAAIQRVKADPAARNLLVDHFTPSGKVDDVKIVSIHTDQDGLILVENTSDYAAKVPAGNFTLGVVVEDEPSHCGFTEAELAAAWESLRGWVAGLPQPTASDLQMTCEGLVAGSLAGGPCRIDPDFDVRSIDRRVRPRTVCVDDDDTLCIDGRFAVETAWKDFEGKEGEGSAVPLTAETGAFWFFGPNNLELMLKVLDGRQINDHFWVFYGALSNVEYTINVTDTVTLEQKVYMNPLGNFASNADVEAF